jgi:hypothetical protein
VGVSEGDFCLYRLDLGSGCSFRGLLFTGP